MTTKKINYQKTGYGIFINDNKEYIINKLKKNQNKGYEILIELSKEWKNLAKDKQEIYKKIAKYINKNVYY